MKQLTPTLAEAFAKQKLQEIKDEEATEFQPELRVTSLLLLVYIPIPTVPEPKLESEKLI